MKKILIMIIDEESTFEAHGEAFGLVDIPPEFDAKQSLDKIVDAAQQLVMWWEG